MSPQEILGLGLAAAMAGAINSVAGGGTLVTFPVLLFYGTSSLVANATSTLALVIGTGGSIYGFRALFPQIRSWLVRFVPVSLLGGWLGSLLLTRTKEGTFDRLVPFLVLFATILFLAQGAFRRFARRHHSGLSGRALVLSLLFQFGVSVYGG